MRSPPLTARAFALAASILASGPTLAASNAPAAPVPDEPARAAPAPTAPAPAAPAPVAPAPAAPARATPAPTAPAPQQVAPAALPPLPVIERIDFAKMYAGVVIGGSLPDAGGASGSTRGWALARCKTDAVWAVLTDHSRFPEFMPRLTAVEVSRRTEHGERALQTVDASLATIRYTLDYQWDKALLRVDYQLAEEVPHDLKAVRGHWQLWPLDHGATTLIEYESRVEVGRPIPGFIRRHLSERGLRDTLNAIARRSEQSAPK